MFLFLHLGGLLTGWVPSQQIIRLFQINLFNQCDPQTLLREAIRQNRKLYLFRHYYSFRKIYGTIDNDNVKKT